MILLICPSSTFDGLIKGHDGFDRKFSLWSFKVVYAGVWASLSILSVKFIYIYIYIYIYVYMLYIYILIISNNKHNNYNSNSIDLKHGQNHMLGKK